MQARRGIPGFELPADHVGWLMEADYLAGLCATLTYIVRPDRIIFGVASWKMPTCIHGFVTR
jgi:fructokinase